MGKHAQKKADMSGDRWKDEDDFVMFFIYTPIFTINLASKERRTELPAIHLRCHSVRIFILSNSTFLGPQAEHCPACELTCGLLRVVISLVA